MGRFFHPFSDICLLNPVEIWGNVPENLKEVLVELRVPWHFKIYGTVNRGCTVFSPRARGVVWFSTASFGNYTIICDHCAFWNVLHLESRIGGQYHLATPTMPTTFIPAILQSCFPRGMRSLCYSESSGAFGVQSALIWPAFHQFDWDCTTAIFPCRIPIAIVTYVFNTACIAFACWKCHAMCPIINFSKLCISTLVHLSRFCFSFMLCENL